MKGLDILRLRMDDNDANADTIGQYLIELSYKCWNEEEGFSGKRPFGNSGWSWDLYQPLIREKLITGELDEDGYITDVDEKAGNDLLREAYAYLYDIVRSK